MLTPGFHSAFQGGAGVAQAAQALRDELRSFALGAYRKNRQIGGKLVRKLLFNVSEVPIARSRSPLSLQGEARWTCR